MKKLFILLICGIAVGSCQYESSHDFPDGDVVGFRPIYGDSLQAHIIAAEEAREINNPGKIYVYNNLLLVNELFKGVHVINNSNPKVPKPLYFIKIPGNIDVAMKGNVIYADNFRDLLAIEISASGVEKITRRKNALDLVRNNFEVPPSPGYFECVDPAKGYVVEWEETTLNSPDCRF